MTDIIKRISNLITIKSLVTIVLTVAFVILSLRGCISSELFMQVYIMIIAFYYGTTKRDDTSIDSNK